jgi:peptidoglycan/xylan/chitin deacetylase (PgdA/CDA1 family)
MSTTDYLPTALTFDDGPTSTTTSDLLKVLDYGGAKATFFVLGSRISSLHDVLAEISELGHEVGNHSWSHQVFSQLKDIEFLRELEQTHNLIEKVTGSTPKLLRPPYGIISAHQKKLAEETFGYSTVMWNLDTEDWRKPGVSHLVQILRSSLNKGKVILLHDLYHDTIKAIEHTIRTYTTPAAEFVTVTKLREIFKKIEKKGSKIPQSIT